MYKPAMIDKTNADILRTIKRQMVEKTVGYEGSYEGFVQIVTAIRQLQDAITWEINNG